MNIKNHKDFWAGIMFISFGLFFAGFGLKHSIGTAAKMGPGYFPTALAVIVTLLGVVMLAASLSPKAATQQVDRFHFPALILVLGSVVLFGLLLNLLGLMVSLLVLIAISSYASHEYSLKATLLNAAVLILICLVVFVWALKLQFPLWPSFINS